MITLITVLEKNPKTGVEELVVSHGVDEIGRNICLPGDHPRDMGGVYSDELREWVLYPPSGDLCREVKPTTGEPPKTPPGDWFGQDYGGGPSM